MRDRLIYGIGVLLLMVCTSWIPSMQEMQNLDKPIVVKTALEPLVEITYIAHASFKVSYKEKTILIDPYADKIWLGYNFPKEIQADAIFSTHPHYDHDGGLFLGKTPSWKDKIPFYTDPGSYQIGEIAIKGIQGKHCDPYGKEFGQKNTIWVITIGSFTLVHLGDNGPLTGENYKALKEGITNIDVLMVPIDSQYHILKAKELQEVLKNLNPTVAIPMHYRIPELEDAADKPKDLGDITPYLKGKTNVNVLDSNSVSFRPEMKKSTLRYMVLKHAAEVTK